MYFWVHIISSLPMNVPTIDHIFPCANEIHLFSLCINKCLNPYVNIDDFKYKWWCQIYTSECIIANDSKYITVNDSDYINLCIITARWYEHIHASLFKWINSDHSKYIAFNDPKCAHTNNFSCTNANESKSVSANYYKCIASKWPCIS